MGLCKIIFFDDSINVLFDCLVVFDKNIKLKDIATIFFIGLKKFHEDLKLEDVYDLIDIFLEEKFNQNLLQKEFL